MEIEAKEADGFIHLVLSGKIDSTTASEFEGALIAQLDKQSHSVVIDLSAVDFVSSAGLRVFLLGAKKVKGTAIKMILCGLDPNIRKVFAMSGFDRILSISDTLEDAVAEATQ